MARSNIPADSSITGGRGGRPPNFCARGFGVLLLAALSVAIPSFFIHDELSRRSFERCAGAVGPLMAFAVAGGLPGGTANNDDDLAALQRLAQDSARIRWIAILRTLGGVMEVRQGLNLPAADIARQVGDSHSVTCRPLMVGNVPSRDLELWTCPGPAAGDTLAAVVTADRSADSALSAIAAPLAFGAIGLVASWVLYLIGVVRPLRLFQTRVLALRAELLGTAGSAATSQLEAPLAALEEIHAELRRWRREATVLRHSVDARVDARTRASAQALRASEQDADTDPLTRLRTRRSLQRELPGLFETMRESGRDLAVVWLDVNNLKVLNDTLGHPAGDELLTIVGDVARACLRQQGDWAVRYGGDEFVLLLTDTNLADAARVVERLATLFNQRIRKFSTVTPPPGISTGLASLVTHGPETCDALLKLADEAMYVAKREGRLIQAAPGNALLSPVVTAQK